MTEKKEAVWLSKYAESTIKESNASLLDLVKEDKQTSKKKVYPEDQISPALSAFENRIAKSRAVE